jgi:hypothetical protein
LWRAVAQGAAVSATVKDGTYCRRASSATGSTYRVRCNSVPGFLDALPRTRVHDTIIRNWVANDHEIH